ncbi:MAG TPA: nuclease [Gammaproteobacteria bacterium]|nr:nuclease [Gammaproteobacteria bacterium]
MRPSGGPSRCKKASPGGAFFLWVFFCCGPGAGAGTLACPPDRVDEQARVAWVHDGDTVRLKDGRKLRLIGFNTPELGRDGRPAEPYAKAARDALKRLLARGAIQLRFDFSRRDHYGRTLAHAFDERGRSLAALLLQEGLATALVIPPDLWNMACYLKAEKLARQQRKGLWSLPRYQPVPVSRLPRTAEGFHLVKGRIYRIGESRRHYWLNLDRDVALRVNKDDLDYFGGRKGLFALQGKKVIARGWIYRRDGDLRIPLRHRADIEIVP